MSDLTKQLLTKGPEDILFKCLLMFLLRILQNHKNDNLPLMINRHVLKEPTMMNMGTVWCSRSTCHASPSVWSQLHLNATFHISQGNIDSASRPGTISASFCDKRKESHGVVELFLYFSLCYINLEFKFSKNLWGFIYLQYYLNHLGKSGESWCKLLFTSSASQVICWSRWLEIWPDGPLDCCYQEVVPPFFLMWWELRKKVSYMYSEKRWQRKKGWEWIICAIDSSHEW